MHPNSCSSGSGLSNAVQGIARLPAVRPKEQDIYGASCTSSCGFSITARESVGDLAHQQGRSIKYRPAESHRRRKTRPHIENRGSSASLYDSTSNTAASHGGIFTVVVRLFVDDDRGAVGVEDRPIVA